MSVDNVWAGVVGLAATANLMVAQITPDDAASWFGTVSKLSATAILGIAVYVLWQKTEKQSGENKALREQHVESLRGVINESTKAMQRNNDVLERLERKL